MGTQGLISVVSGEDVIYKVICGCGGYNIDKMVKYFEKYHPRDPKKIYKMALNCDFGCRECLVVQIGPKKYIYKEDGNDDISELYEKEFQNSRFNPRWECGIVEYLAIIKLTDQDETPALEARKKEKEERERYFKKEMKWEKWEDFMNIKKGEKDG